ncbi:MAG: DUF3488 and transglutaminase-like domain-containing protein [Acidobacteriota bacterium]
MSTSPAKPLGTGVATTVFEVSVLGMLASGYFAVVGSSQLDLPTIVVMFLALCVRSFMIAGLLRVNIPSQAVAAISLLYAGFYPLDMAYVSHGFLPATVHMIFFVAVIKIITARTARDFAYVKAIAVLELLSAATLSTHLSFFVFLATFVLSAIAAFASGEVVRSSESAAASSPTAAISSAGVRGFPRRLVFLTAALFCAILTMTAGIFFVLPRTARAAFQRFAFQRQHLPGFASEVTLGEIGELKQNSAAVMHIRAYKEQPLPDLRWRGSALTTFDGKRWFNPLSADDPLPVQQGQLVLAAVRQARPGKSFSYEVDLSEIAPDMLFFAGTPETISIRVPFVFRTPWGSWRAPRFGFNGLHYGAYSRVEDETALPTELPPPLSDPDRAGLLQLPPLDVRIPELARKWTADGVSQQEKAELLVRRFHQDFKYSLNLLQTSVPDPLAHFLFVRKEGHCEYFASSMAVMLRTVGIPSRVATGFLGGEYNPISGWQVLRASDAHSWVEAWIPGRGWTTFDPTPPDPNAAAEPGLWSQASLVFDAADQVWRDWIVGYDFDHQLFLVSRVESAGRLMRWPKELFEGGGFDLGLPTQRWWLFTGFAALLAIAGIAFYGPAGRRWWNHRMRWMRAQRGKVDPSDATQLYERMLRLLERRGYQKPPWFTPQEFVAVLPASELSLLVSDLTDAYNQVRFGSQRLVAPRMAHLLQRIERLLA